MRDEKAISMENTNLIRHSLAYGICVYWSKSTKVLPIKISTKLVAAKRSIAVIIQHSYLPSFAFSEILAFANYQ